MIASMRAKAGAWVDLVFMEGHFGCVVLLEERTAYCFSKLRSSGEVLCAGLTFRDSGLMPAGVKRVSCFVASRKNLPTPLLSSKAATKGFASMPLPRFPFSIPHCSFGGVCKHTAFPKDHQRI